MKTFKSSALTAVGNFTGCTIGALFLAFLVWWFTNGNLLYAGIALVLGEAFAIWISFFSGVVTVTVDEKKVCIYKRKKMQYAFERSACQWGYHIHNDDCTLNVRTPEGETQDIDCSGLGVTRFEQLLDTLGFNDPATQKVVTQKAKSTKE